MNEELEQELLPINKAMVAKVKCLKTLLFHTRFFFVRQYKRKFIVNRHHEIICDVLEKVLRGEITRLLISVAPRYTKTELAVKNFISHGLSLNPSAKFIHLSYGDDIALDNSDAVKDIIQTPAYQQLFPEVKLKKGTTAKDKWYTDKNGGVLARAAGGQVTGFGAGQVDKSQDELDAELAEYVTEIDNSYIETDDDLDKKWKFNGAIIIDDPIKPEDADQDTIRVKVNNRFDSTIRNRVNSRKTPIIVIMQRLHPEDLIGYLQREDEADKWTVISLPCINQEGNQYGLTPGESLWPFKHTIEELHKLKKANEIVFERQYMQNPQPKAGLLFPIQELNMYDHAQENFDHDEVDFIYIPVDPANLGGDDFAAIVCKLKAKQKKIFVTDVLYNLEGADVNEKNVVDLVMNEKAHACGIEGVFGWAETVKRIREALSIKKYPGEIRQLKPRTAKHVRIVSRSSFIKNYLWFRKDYMHLPQYDKFMRNLTSYKKIQEPGKMNKHDEAPDVCEMAGSYFEKNFPELWLLP